ncbi:MAG TPA: MoaD/ThiS family protein [Egibacteraceae bacterium]
MAIEVRVPTVLRQHTGGEKTVTGEGATLRELVADLERSHPGLGKALVDDSGSLHRFVNVYVNDEDVRFLGGVETPLEDGDTVSILPAVAGG